jgi:hypothetical protein
MLRDDRHRDRQLQCLILMNGDIPEADHILHSRE